MLFDVTTRIHRRSADLRLINFWDISNIINNYAVEINCIQIVNPGPRFGSRIDISLHS